MRIASFALSIEQVPSAAIGVAPISANPEKIGRNPTSLATRSGHPSADLHEGDYLLVAFEDLSLRRPLIAGA